MKNLIVIAFLFCVALNNKLLAAHEVGSARLVAPNLAINNAMYLQDNKYASISSMPSTSTWGFYDKSFTNRLKFGIDRYSTVTLDNFVATVTVNITSIKPVALGGGSSTITQTLSISYEGKNDHQATTPHISNDLQVYTYNNAYATLITISNIAVSINGGANTTTMPANAYLELEMDAERYYPLDQSVIPISNTSDFLINYIPNSDEFEISWTKIEGAESYDLEWLWLDAEKNTFWSNNSSIVDFRNNSTRIRTSQQSYRVSNVFEKGQVLFRLRGVGVVSSVTNAYDKEGVTPWTCNDAISIPSGLASGSVYDSPTNIFYITLDGSTVISGNVPPIHESNKNWQYKSTYAEEGKKKEVISYFDGTLRNRQSVTKINSDENAIVGETYYDYNGRGAVQTLPVPVADAKIKFYEYNASYPAGFNFVTGTTNPYGKKYFDEDVDANICQTTAQALDNNYGTAQYYSPNSAFISQLAQGYVPDAELYPISQTVFANDNTGRILKQGGVGKAHQIGTGHETTYYYGTPEQEELDRLFGSEVGQVSHYKKNMVIDANGQVSVSYLDQQGRTIATALTGQTPDNMSSLKDINGNVLYTPPSADNLLSVNLLNKLNSTDVDSPLDNNMRSGNELVFSKQLLVPTASTYTISYDLKGTSFTYSCLPTNACYDCVYDLEIDIYDKCMNNPVGFTKITHTLGNIIEPGTSENPAKSSYELDTICNQEVNFNTTQLTSSGDHLLVNLPQGEYTIVKKLKINNQALDYYLNEYLKSDCVKDTSYFLNPAGADTSGCNLTCDECIAALGTQSLYISNGGTAEQWQEEYNICKAPCEYASMCDASYQMMLSDVSPGGQYAEWQDNDGGCNTGLYNLSVLNENNSLPNQKKVNLSQSAYEIDTPTWKNPKHRDSNASGSPFTNKFFEEDGTTRSIIYVTEISTGVFNPPLIPAATYTLVSGSSTQYAVYPEHLANVADFIANWKSSWATSLVYYHPEYPYYDWCLKNSTEAISSPYNVTVTSGTNTIIGTVSTSDSYDSLLLATDDITAIISADLSKLTNVLTNDPYWIKNGHYYNCLAPGNYPTFSQVGVPIDQINHNLPGLSPPWNFFYNGATNSTTNPTDGRYGNYQNSNIPLHTFAAIITTSCAIQYGQPISNQVSCLSSYGITTTSTASDIINALSTDELKNKYWDNFRMMYLAMKQEFQQEAAESYVMNSASYRGCNDCIGSPGFDPTAQTVPFTDYKPVISGLSVNHTNKWFIPFNSVNQAQYCGLLNGGMYNDKIKRFSSANDARGLQNNTPDVGASIYANTGLCPNAFYLQGLLNSLSASTELGNASINLSTKPEFNPDLYKIVNGGTITTTYTQANWTSSHTSTDLSAQMQIGTGSPCQLTLNFPTTSAFNWSNTGFTGASNAFLKLYQLSPGTSSSGIYNFTIKADITDAAGTSGVVTTITLDGTTCIPLTGCLFIPPCEPTTQAFMIQKALNAIASDINASTNTSNISTANISMDALPVQPTFVNSIKPFLTIGNTSENWQWTKLGGTPDFKIYDQAAYSSHTLKVSFNTLNNPSTGNTLVFSNITGNSTAENYFNITVKELNTSTGAIVTTYTTFGYVLIDDLPNKMGNCSFDVAKCNSIQHQTREDFEKFILTPSITASLQASTASLTPTQAFGLNMRNQLAGNQTYNSSTNLVDPLYYYWDNNTPALSTQTLLTGSFFASNANTIPTTPSTACSFSLTCANPTLAVANGFNINTTTYTLSNFVLAAEPLIGGSIYNFSVTATYAGQPYVLLGTSSCFAMRACSECTSPPINSHTLMVNSFNCNQTNSYTVTSSSINYSLSTSSNNNDPCSTLNIASSQYGATNQALMPSASPINSVSAYLSTLSYTNNSLFIRTAGSNTFQISNTVSALHSCIQQAYVKFRVWTSPAIGVIQSPSSMTVALNGSVVPFFGYGIGGGIWREYIYGPITSSASNYSITVSVTPLAIGFFGFDELKLDYTSCPEVTGSLPCVQIADQYKPFPEIEYEDPCLQYANDILQNNAQERYNDYIDSLKTQFVQGYIKKCMGNAIENMNMKYHTSDYHFTLYYYDQAGNLVRTVPPQGVLVETNPTTLNTIKQERAAYPTGATKTYYTNHSLYTTYAYNSLNQLVKQETPDAGISLFWYDKLGRLVASQNAKQKDKSTANNNIYSYTKYDYLGRIAEAGEMSIIEDFSSMATTDIDLALNPTTNNYPNNLALAKTEVTRTYYGDDDNYMALIPGSKFTAGEQEYLRSRVAAVTIEDADDNNNSTYNHGTHYSYDVHGNVKELVQQNAAISMLFPYHQYKKINYQYDLISGKVNQVAYQPNEIDMLLHRYEYDADNRITNVFTSTDNVIWNQDAKYFYYKHGPLARTEIGHHKVQGVDYAYTLQGWIKGVNSNILDPENDIGQDANVSNITLNISGGAINKFVAKDAYGYSLTYFDNDNYKDYIATNGLTTGNHEFFIANTSAITAQSPDLYNGNIRQMVTSYLDASSPAKTYETKALLRNFAYDQLNRIETANSFDDLNLGDNVWTGSQSVTDMYNEHFTYDQNGNILHATRNGHLVSTLSMDNLTYNYIPNTNKLNYVADAISGTPYGNDFASGQSTGNYQYDKIGNLIADASEEIANIEWTVYGKIKRITHKMGSGKPNLDFAYDASGNRISKTVYHVGADPTTTYYVRDAQGNVMATYENKIISDNKPLIFLGEQHLYGSSRLGLINNDLNVHGFHDVVPSPTLTTRTLGQKAYELSNHLGNVIAVVSDRKISVDTDNNDITNYFSSEILSANDYFAFGGTMNGRGFTSGTNYRYGFNGKENDKETGTQDYGFRIYNTSLGKFLSVDPLTKSYPELTPYQFASDNPIQNIDFDGLEGKPAQKQVNGTSSDAQDGTYRAPVLILKPITKEQLKHKIYDAVMAALTKDKNLPEILESLDNALHNYAASVLGNMVIYGTGTGGEGGKKQDLQKLKGKITVLDLGAIVEAIGVMKPSNKESIGTKTFKAPTKGEGKGIEKAKDNSKDLYKGEGEDIQSSSNRNFGDTTVETNYWDPNGSNTEFFTKNVNGNTVAPATKKDKEEYDSQPH